MKHCEKCNVEVNTKLDYCPLCFNNLSGESKEPKIYEATKDKPREIIKSHKTRKIFILISLAVITICALINYFTETPLWSGIVALGILYLWILVKHTIASDRNVFEKIFLQVVTIIGLLILTNYVSGGGWFLDYVFPSLLCFVVLVLDFILMISNKRRNYEISFLIIELLVLVASIVFVCINVLEFKLLHIITLTLTALSIVGLLIMDGKNIFQEISKKVHI